mmetsp:Transcript_2427/g.4680  ORF Transcript_2427/g.4680 Transcript_2427/m.4680 type:complete len:356 (+) Transcript_2427:148-1215(+)
MGKDWVKAAVAAAVVGIVQASCVCYDGDTKLDCSGVRAMEDLVALGDSVTRVTCYSSNAKKPAIAGQLDASVQELSALQWLHIEGADLGTIPSELGELDLLEMLWLPRNKLTGEIPASFENLTRLASLNLNMNQLSGSLPVELTKLESLTNLELWRNELSGPLPDTIGDLTNLENLWLSDNKFSDALPASLAELTKLENLVLSGNQFYGPVPPLSNLENLKSLYVASEYTCGDPPQFTAEHSDIQAGEELRNCSDVATPGPTTSPTTSAPTITSEPTAPTTPTIAPLTPSTAPTQEGTTETPVNVPSSSPVAPPTYSPNRTPRPSSAPTISAAPRFPSASLVLCFILTCLITTQF